MLATANVATAIASGVDCPSPQNMALPSLSLAPFGTTSLTVHASARTAAMSDTTDLTNLGWLQKPGVLTSMCTALTGPQQNGVKAGSARGPRRSRQLKTSGGKLEQSRSRAPRSSDKMVNVILNVRNRKYNGEDDASKPPLSFACMIFMAVESSPTKTLPVKGIYDWVMWKFPFYRDAAPGWKNSVRHNLSLNKCFKKVNRYSGKSGSAVSKGGLWTVDPDYRRSLLAALKRSPYHPYHCYSFPLSPSSSSNSLDEVDPAERDAALTMCMIGGNPDGSDPLGPELLYAVYHDHCYTKCPPIALPPLMTPPQRVTIKLNNTSKKDSGKLTIDEIVAAAELILAQDAEEGEELSSDQSSDEGLGGEVFSDLEEEEEEEEEAPAEMASDNEQELHGIGGSHGYSITSSQHQSPSMTRLDLMSSLDEMGANALLCLATGSSSTEASTTSVA